MRISNVLAVTFALLHCSSQIQNQGRKGEWIHFKFGTFCPAAGKPEREKKLPVNIISIILLQSDINKTLLILHDK